MHGAEAQLQAQSRRLAGEIAGAFAFLLEERIVVGFLRHRGERTVAGADQGRRGKGKDFFANGGAREVKMGASPSDRSCENGVADDGYRWRSGRKFIDYIGDSIVGMARCLSEGDFQFSDIEGLVVSQLLRLRSAFYPRVKERLR